MGKQFRVTSGASPLKVGITLLVSVQFVLYK